MKTRTNTEMKSNGINSSSIISLLGLLSVSLWMSVSASIIPVFSRQDGDIMLGALFPIHAKSSSFDGCGSLQVQYTLSFSFVV